MLQQMQGGGINQVPPQGQLGQAVPQQQPLPVQQPVNNAI